MTGVDYSDGSEMDLRIRGSLEALKQWRGFERDVHALCLWLGVEDTREMFRAALKSAEQRGPVWARS